MKRLTQNNSNEDKAEALWANFSLRKESGFWIKYEALLKKSKQVKPPPVSVPPVARSTQTATLSPPIQTPVQNIVAQTAALSKPNSPEERYAPASGIYIWRIICSLGGPALFAGAVYSVFFSDEELSIVLDIIIMVFAFFLGIVYPLFAWSELHTFSTSGLGIHVKKVLLPKKTLFAWKDIEWVELKEEPEGGEDTWCYLTIHSVTGTKGRFKYHLSEKNHRRFKNAIEKRYIRFSL